jgi:diguanylate cyclase (GGDEF)-like protein
LKIAGIQVLRSAADYSRVTSHALGSGPRAGTAGEVPAQTLAETQLIDDRRARAGQRLSGRDRIISGLGVLVFLALAISLALLGGGSRDVQPGVALLLIVSFAALARVEFEIGPGTLVPTQLILVPMLFVLPPARVPLAVGGGLLLSGLVDQIRRHLHPERLLVGLYYSLYSLGPAAVLVAARVSAPTWHTWWILVLALCAQFAVDALSVVVREVVALRADARVVVKVLPRVYAMDLLLSPVGLLAAVACETWTLAFLAVLPLGLLFQLGGVDRRARIDDAVELTGAYESASRAARTDDLTGLSNRRAWEERLLEISAPCAVVLLDIDGLKRANDTRGHEFGDRVIREVATAAMAILGGGDGLVARIGGDELGALLPGVSPAIAAALVTDLQAAFAAHPGLDGMPLSASVGAAAWPPESTLGAAVEAADRGVYASKRERRDRLQ